MHVTQSMMQNNKMKNMSKRKKKIIHETQSIMKNNIMNNLFKSQAAMNKYLNQVQTGEKIERPSDDPVIAMKGMSYRTALREIEQYQRNADGIRSWMDNAD